MKNTSYEERKKCCLKELLGQTPRALSLLRNTLSRRKNQVELTIVDPFADSIAKQIGDEYIKSAKSVSLQNVTFEKYIDALWQETPLLVKATSDNNAEFKQWVERLWAFQSWPNEKK
jgi:hypothetical protein